MLHTPDNGGWLGDFLKRELWFVLKVKFIETPDTLDVVGKENIKHKSENFGSGNETEGVII